MEAFFWGQEADSETNYARYQETLAILREGLSHEQLTYAGRFHSFDKLPMYLRPLQKPYPPLWYMRNPVTAAVEGMHTIIVGSIDGLAVAVPRYHAAWEEHQGKGTLTIQGQEPKIGLVVHMVVAETDDEALKIARPAWEKYRWNLAAPRRLEAEKRNLTQFMSTKDGSFGFVGDRPSGLPSRELRRDIDAELERFDQVKQGSHPNRLGGVALAGTPAALREYMDEYVATGANYFVCSFQWGDLTHAQAMRSIELFATEVMPAYSAV
jgi:alkanesulfonate monooxygenase SsuD/methylene tetrahydromethanopterin reductase-like flavin-dependent oxidoreductase (luciferase family)